MNVISQPQGVKAAATDRIPVSLLTGFLGAGKTTLLNALMKHPEMAGTAVLINEFGEVGIDHHLVGTLDETMVLLDSGCLCCTMRGDLVAALRTLHERLSKREIPAITRVLIETTGLADPAPVVYTLMEERFTAARYVCDSVLTVIDASHGLEQIARHREAMRQAALADRLLITKTDLADSLDREKLDALLRTINPGAPRLEVRDGRIAPGFLFGTGLYSPEGKQPEVASWLGEEGARDQDHGHGESHHHHENHHDCAEGDTHLDHAHHAHMPAHSHAHRHDGAISSFSVTFARPVAWRGFTAAMGEILKTYGARILRAKGLMNVAGDPCPVVVQCVQDAAYPSVRLAEWPKDGSFKSRQGRMVFITDGLTACETLHIRYLLMNLPNDAVAARMIATTPLLATRCWLSLRSPMNSAGVIELDGWFVQPKRYFVNRNAAPH